MVVDAMLALYKFDISFGLQCESEHHLRNNSQHDLHELNDALERFSRALSLNLVPRSHGLAIITWSI